MPSRRSLPPPSFPSSSLTDLGWLTEHKKKWFPNLPPLDVGAEEAEEDEDEEEEDLLSIDSEEQLPPLVHRGRTAGGELVSPYEGTSLRWGGEPVRPSVCALQYA